VYGGFKDALATASPYTISILSQSVLKFLLFVILIGIWSLVSFMVSLKYYNRNKY